MRPRYVGCWVAAALAVTVLSAGSAAGAQYYDVRDGEQIRVSIAVDELTRITMHADRIDKFWDAGEYLISEADEDNGILFVRPTVAGIQKGIISFFVQDSSGRTYHLLATPTEAVPPSIVLRASTSLPSSSAECARAVPEPHVRTIKRLVRAMARGVALHGFDVVEAQKETRLWQEVDLALVRQYRGASLLGEIYRLTNTSSAAVVLAESEFVSLGTAILAVAIESIDVAAGAGTVVYVVRRGEKP